MENTAGPSVTFSERGKGEEEKWFSSGTEGQSDTSDGLDVFPRTVHG